MKKGIMNKNVTHDKVSYPKGSVVSEDKHGDHFKILAKAGHVDQGHEEKMAEAPEAPAPDAPEGEQEAADEGKKHGRNRR